MGIITKCVLGYEGLYEINILGEIYSLPKSTVGTRRISKGSANNSGYICVSLCRGGKHKTLTVHRLVMETFVGQRPDGMDIDHINGNKLDNRLSNLRYCSRSENMSNARRNGFNNRGENSKFSKLTQNDVDSIRMSKDTQRQLSESYNVSIATISRVINRKIWVYQN